MNDTDRNPISWSDWQANKNGHYSLEAYNNSSPNLRPFGIQNYISGGYWADFNAAGAETRRGQTHITSYRLTMARDSQPNTNFFITALQFVCVCWFLNFCARQLSSNIFVFQ